MYAVDQSYAIMASKKYLKTLLSNVLSYISSLVRATKVGRTFFKKKKPDYVIPCPMIK